MQVNNVILQNVSVDDLRQIIKEEMQSIAPIKEKAVTAIKTSSTEPFLTRKEAAEYLKISLTTLWELTRRGKLKSYSVGGGIRYRIDEINSAMKGGDL